VGGINTSINTDVEAYVDAYVYQLVYELAYAHVVLLGQGFELVMEASGNNYMRKAFLSHISTMPLRLLFCCFGFLNGSMEFSVMVSSFSVGGEPFFCSHNSRNIISLAVWKYPPSRSSFRLAVMPLKSSFIVLAFSI